MTPTAHVSMALGLLAQAAQALDSALVDGERLEQKERKAVADARAQAELAHGDAMKALELLADGTL